MRKRLRTGRAGNDDGFTMIPSWFETPGWDQTLRSRSDAPTGLRSTRNPTQAEDDMGRQPAAHAAVLSAR